MNSRRPLVPLALAFALGTGAPLRLPADRPELTVGGAAAGLVLLAAAPALRVPAFALLGASARAVAQAPDAPPTATPPLPGPTERGEVWLEGIVAGAPERFDDRVRFALAAHDGRRYQTWCPSPDWPLAPGDRIRLRARLRRPEGARNPNGRDPAAQLAARGIREEALGVAAPVRVGRPSPLARLERARRDFAERAAAVLPAREAGLVRAIGTGDRDGVDAATNDAFARSGLAHVLSVSGLHLAVVAAGFFAGVRALLLRIEPFAARHDARRVAALAAIPFAALYAVGTGASVPVLRAAAAASAGFLAVALDREPEPLNTLALAALAVLAADPGALGDPSFQLSFASVAGLALGTAPLRAALRVTPPPAHPRLLARAREWLLLSLCASAAASVATAPLVALHFRRIPLAGLLSNVPGVPISSALTVTATAAALLDPLCSPLATLALHASRPLAWLLLAVNDAFAAPAWAAPAVASPGPVATLGALAAALALLAVRRPWARAALAATWVALLVAPGPLRGAAAALRGDVLEVVFLSVGQGDCALLRLPGGGAVLVDAGGDPNGHADPGARDVVPFLLDAGVRELAAVIVSHPHPDHVLGLAAVARTFPVREVVAPGVAATGASRDALALLPPPRQARAGDAWTWRGVRFEVLGPPADTGGWAGNDASLVLRVTHGRTRLLLTGDVEAAGEAALVANAGDRLRADVVKVPHHGSPTSSGAALVEAARPRWAVASVGARNRWRFPDPEVVARWEAAGAEVLRTSDGAVRLLSDGEAVRRSPAGAAVDALALLRERP